MKKIESYICEICNKKFDSEDEAKMCEKSHNVCVCQSGKPDLSKRLYEVIAYGKGEFIYVDYRFPAIVKLRRYGDYDGYYIYDNDKIPIKYCPYCGRKLVETENKT